MILFKIIFMVATSATSYRDGKDAGVVAGVC